VSVQTPTRQERPPQDAVDIELLEGLEGSSLINARRSRRDQLTRRLLGLGDALSILFAMSVAMLLTDVRDDSWALLAWTVVSLPAWVLLLKIYKLYENYTRRISHTVVEDVPWLFHSLLVGSLGFWMLTHVLPVEKMALIEGTIFGITALVTILLTRSAMARLALRTFGSETVLMAGGGPNMQLLLRKINQHPEFGLAPIALLDGFNSGVRDAGDFAHGARPHSGATSEFDHLCQDLRPQRAIIARDGFRADQVIGMIDTCRRLSIKVSILPDAVESLGPSLEVDAIQGVTLLGVNPPMLGVTSRAIKRSFDVIISCLLLLLAAPLMLLIAIGVKLDSRGPVFFRQERVGRQGRRFKLFKFRTMSTDAETRHAELMKQSRDPNWLDLAIDPRVTRLGRHLRRTSLDELPQLFNVLRGEMSLVGPRPLPEAEDARVDGYARGRLDLTPGMTGLWQVLGRTAIPFEEMVKLDYMYVTNWSLWLDLRVMLQTVPAVFGRRGVN
jgi:exopolysaccharide biosynthesis polyprenyl glycosylphosphotransferase